MSLMSTLATNRMHTGRPISGTISYPSIGSIIAHQRGAASDEAPPYVLIGYPNAGRYQSALSRVKQTAVSP